MSDGEETDTNPSQEEKEIKRVLGAWSHLRETKAFRVIHAIFAAIGGLAVIVTLLIGIPQVVDQHLSPEPQEEIVYRDTATQIREHNGVTELVWNDEPVESAAGMYGFVPPYVSARLPPFHEWVLGGEDVMVMPLDLQKRRWGRSTMEVHVLVDGHVMVVVYANDDSVARLRRKDTDSEIMVEFRFVPFDGHSAIGLPVSRLRKWDYRRDIDARDAQYPEGWDNFAHVNVK